MGDCFIFNGWMAHQQMAMGTGGMALPLASGIDGIGISKRHKNQISFFFQYRTKSFFSTKLIFFVLQ
jgi:hypothetical protein